MELFNLVKIIFFLLMGGYVIFFVNKFIVVYYDGLWFIMLEFMNGNMSWKELVGIFFVISIGFIIGFVMLIILVIGIIVIYIVLLIVDIIGVLLNNIKLVVLIGIVYGVLIIIVLDGLIKGFSYLLVNFFDVFVLVGDLIIYVFVVFFVIVVGY